jgi:hypothetical protein
LILALLEKRVQLCPQGQHDAEQSRRQETLSGNFEVCSVWVVSNQMETAMNRSIVSIAGSFAILAAGLLVSGAAQAGGGATSAASKYGHTSQVAAVHQVNRQAQSFAITEYSSSSARTHAAKYR